MNKIYKQKGFTLIEVMVVVLLIGILSSIAVPSYRKAVEKTKVAEGAIGIRAIDTAAREKFLIKKSLFDISSLEDINIELSAGEMDEYGQYVTKDWTFTIGGDKKGWKAKAVRNTGDYELNTWIEPDSSGRISIKHMCSDNGSSIGQSICKDLETKGWESAS